MAFRDIRKSRRWLSAEEFRFIVFSLLVLILLLAVNIMLARSLPGGEWLYLRWSGARAFLAAQTEAAVEGQKLGRTMPGGSPVVLVDTTQPYGAEIARLTQEVAYGRLAFSSEYSYILNDPFPLLLLYIPLALISDFSIVRGIWALLSQAALVATVVLAINLSEWQPPRWLYPALLIFGLFSFFSLNALATGSPAAILVLLYAWILLALRSFSDELAGGLLALTAYQWEVGGLFFLFILFFAIHNRRWGVLTGLAMALFVLLVASLLIDPNWGLPYIRAVLSGWIRGANLTFGQTLAMWFPNAGLPLGTIVSIGLGLILFIEWIAAANAHFRRVVWAACLSLAVTPLIGFAIFPSNHVVLLLPFILILTLTWERWQRRR
ncbi:MAG: glycosyltransferase 87 family protein, partial [Chloroflexota bacterium]|nr:glycosyltransferase 87 family protein [Chloroflexota bacterium]